jgi:DNA polymerase V
MIVPLRRPTADTALITQAAVVGLKAIFVPGYKYAKAGVMLLDLGPDSVVQQELDLEPEDDVDRSNLMTTLDRVNRRYGRGTLLLASAGLHGDKRTWSMRQERRTPQYTTCWEDMPTVRA